MSASDSNNAPNPDIFLDTFHKSVIITIDALTTTGGFKTLRVATRLFLASTLVKETPHDPDHAQDRYPVLRLLGRAGPAQEWIRTAQAGLTDAPQGQVIPTSI
jgi:hypothetical protein